MTDLTVDKTHKRKVGWWLGVLILLAPLLTTCTADDFIGTIATPSAETEIPALPIIDMHLHYNEHAWSRYSASEIITILTETNVPHALVSSTPDDGTRLLYDEDPERIVPSLRPYHGQISSGNWFAREESLPYIKERLQTPIYHGIGEFHLHLSADANSPIVRETARLSVEQGLYLHIHTNARIVRKIIELEPDARIIWAHAGMTEPPSAVARILSEHPNVWTEISIREHEIAPGGVLDDQWRDLFLAHPERIMIGSDTFVTSRWDHYVQVIDHNRTWLSQLPSDVAEQIAYKNAARLLELGLIDE
ncbi:MAG: amidohydrolase family protein [Chloroflexota bacterium]